MKTFSHLWKYLADLFLEWWVFQIKVVEKIKKHILCSVTFFPRKSFRLWDNVEKYGGAKGTADNMGPVCGMLDEWAYTRARTLQCLRIHTHTHTNTHPPTHTRTHVGISMHEPTRAHTHTQILLLSTTTTVLWTRLNVTLHVHCLSSLRCHQKKSKYFYDCLGVGTFCWRFPARISDIRCIRTIIIVNYVCKPLLRYESWLLCGFSWKCSRRSLRNA